MYLAQRFIDGQVHFVISHSYREGDWWRHGDLFDLGIEPSRFVTEEAGPDGVSVHALIGEELKRVGIAPGPGELEDLFLPFMSDRLQRMREPSRRRRARRRLLRLRSREKSLAAEISLFDRRRYHYLHSGAFDLSAISILPIAYFLPLADKSRDEIEQYLLFREQQLGSAGGQRYLFSVFNLQHYFLLVRDWATPSPAKHDFLDQLFIEELCRVNASSWFWMREAPPRRLHPLLVRYVLMFFDRDWEQEPEDLRRDGEERFTEEEREEGPPLFQPETEEDQAEALFGRSLPELQAMGPKELTRLYKKRAFLFHPDRGGSPERFILLTQTYETLMKELP